MNFYWVKTNRLIKKLFSNYVWDIPNTENKIYLTFDDGPTPEITEWVLQELEKYNAKATFFCIGNNIEKYPNIFKKVISKGHFIGNHTFNHLNGWKTTTKDYLENVVLCQSAIRRQFLEDSFQKTKSNQQKRPNNQILESGFQKNSRFSDCNLQSQICHLFRPPYGKIKTSQAEKLQQLGYKIIMWDVLSADFDATISKEKCLENVVKNVKSGSIIVFHDSVKAFPHLEYTLPKALAILNKKGFIFEAIK